MNIVKTLLVFSVLAGSPSPARAEGPPGADPVKKVDKLFAAYNQLDSPGAAVVVVKEGKVVLNKGYGMANLQHRLPVTPETVFDVASISKQFTGYAVALLCGQGIISPEDDIRKYNGIIPLDHDRDDRFAGPGFVRDVELYRDKMRYKALKFRAPPTEIRDSAE